jgi:hypothetical protein
MKEVKKVKLYDSELIKKGYKSTRIVQDGLTGTPPSIDEDGYYKGTPDQLAYLKQSGRKVEPNQEED